MWLGSHYALLSGTGLASIIVAAKARGTGKKSVPRSVLEKKEDKERKKKGKGKKSIKSFFSCCVFFFLHCWWRIRCLGKSLPISFYQAVRHTYSLLFQVSVHQFVYFQTNDHFFSPSPSQATCGTVCQPPLFSYDMQGVPGFKLSQGLVFDSESRSVQALTTANG